MFRLFFTLLSTFLFFNGLNAQSDTAPTARLTTQQLSPADAKLQKETKEVDGFARALASLKTVFAEKDASRTVVYEAYILRAMRNEIDQMMANAESVSDPAAKIRLEKTTHILGSFEGHAFDPAQPEIAVGDFAKLDAFLEVMQEALAELKKAKE